MNKLKEFLKSLLSEDYGHISFTRVTTLITMVTVLGVWVYKNIVSETFIDFGDQSAYIILFCLGAKVASKFIEVAGQAKEKELEINSSEQNSSQ